MYSGFWLGDDFVELSPNKSGEDELLLTILLGDMD